MIRFGLPEPLQACAARARFKGLLTPRNAFSQRTSRSQGAAQVLGFLFVLHARARARLAQPLPIAFFEGADCWPFSA